MWLALAIRSCRLRPALRSSRNITLRCDTSLRQASLPPRRALQPVCNTSARIHLPNVGGGYSTGPFCPGLCSPVHCIPGSAVASLRLASLLPTPLGTPPVNPSSSNAKSAREQWENNVRSCDDRGREAYAASNLSSSRWNLQDNRSSPASGRRSCSYHGGHGSSVKHANKVPAKLAAAYVRGRNAKDGDANRVQYQSVHG